MKTETEREQRDWWVISDGRVVHATGYSCSPMNPDSWWFPKVRFSAQVGFHVFADRGAAIAKCKAELLAQRARIEQQLRELAAAEAQAPEEKP